MRVADAPNGAYAFAAALVEELARAGVRHACVCPGSRSAPLAAALAAAQPAAARAAAQPAAARAAAQPALRAWSHLDERAAAFFALGLAKATRSPVALLCTSGTAAANFLPAVVEAAYAAVPLIVLTADRPPELREWGAGQTIDQHRLFGSHVRWFAEAPPPEARPELLRYARALASRAVAAALGRPPGPVHLNLPFREPLHPVAADGDVPAPLAARDPEAAAGRGARPYTRVSTGTLLPDPATLASLGDELASPRGVIAWGPDDADPTLPDAVAALSRASGWPLIADPASQLRCGPHAAETPLVATADLLLRDEAFAGAHPPDVILCGGAPPTSKAFRLWLERHPGARVVALDPDGRGLDPSHRCAQRLLFDAAPFCRALARVFESRGKPPGERAWLAAFLDADRRAREAVARVLRDTPALFGPRVVRELAAALPDGAALYASNSLPVREVDAFLPARAERLRLLVNRGACGIDGMVSSALGASAGGARPLALLSGDLAFLHDLSGLVAAKRHRLPGVVVVLHNDGGGIFSFLPIAEHAEAVGFEEHFLTPHGVELRPAAELCGAVYARAESPGALRSALDTGLGDARLHVIEVPVDRDADLAHHRAVQAAVAHALAAGSGRR